MAIDPKLKALLKHDYERLAGSRSQMPPGYCFVKKGDVFITRHCRESTGAAGGVVYIVYDERTRERVGLRCPSGILREVEARARDTGSTRAAANAAREVRLQIAARAAVAGAFPRMPSKSLEKILAHGFEKGSGRVGRAASLPEPRRLALAVAAHVRHSLTPYDALCDQVGREEARRRVGPQVEGILSEWKSKRPNGNWDARKEAGRGGGKTEPRNGWESGRVFLHKTRRVAILQNKGKQKKTSRQSPSNRKLTR